MILTELDEAGVPRFGQHIPYMMVSTGERFDQRATVGIAIC